MVARSKKAADIPAAKLGRKRPRRAPTPKHFPDQCIFGFRGAASVRTGPEGYAARATLLIGQSTWRSGSGALCWPVARKCLNSRFRAHSPWQLSIDARAVEMPARIRVSPREFLTRIKAPCQPAALRANASTEPHKPRSFGNSRTVAGDLISLCPIISKVYFGIRSILTPEPASARASGGMKHENVTNKRQLGFNSSLPPSQKNRSERGRCRCAATAFVH
jgi:hypothetical protein